MFEHMSKYMAEALKEAEISRKNGEVPIGCVIVSGDEIIGRGHNLVEEEKNPMAHAEMQALQQATKHLKSKWLTGCSMYVTLEPCAMCAGAIVLARLDKIYIGTKDPKSGACGSVFNVVQEEKLNHRTEVEFGQMKEECSGILKEFFHQLRNEKKGLHK